MIPGHPFKGGSTLSTGQLYHPEIKRFGLTSAVFFKPPHPDKNPYVEKPAPKKIDSLDAMLSAYLGKLLLAPAF